MTDAGVERPLVSVVIPCRNERAYIGECLDSILRTDYPADRIEVLVADGMSEDGTREIIADRARRDSRVRMLDNPQRTTPHALNAGISAARGSIIMRMDAHSRYPGTYVRQLVESLEQSGADNVGGVCRTLPANESVTARAVAIALAHPFGVGNAQFRVGVQEPTWVDTVPFGCYRRSVFERIGLFDEELTRNQDDELNHRLVKHGGRILLVPNVVVDYFARASIRSLARMYFQYGLFKPLVIRKLGQVLTVRQLVPPLATLALMASLVIIPVTRWPFVAFVLTYGSAAIIAALVSKADADLRVRAVLTTAFPAMHFGYGLGFLSGVWRFWIRRGQRAEPAALPMSR